MAEEREPVAREHRQRRTHQDVRRRREARPRHTRLSLPVVAVLMALCLAAGALVGAFAYAHLGAPAGAKATLLSKTTVEESELDVVLGTYTYAGNTTEVTIREAIEESSSLESVRNADGTYEVPPADSVLSIARNRLLVQQAEEMGLSASDEDALAYAQETYGTQDMAVIAANYSMTEEQALALMRRSALLKKLKDSVVTTESLTEPVAPITPAEGEQDVPLPEYARYVIELAGDEWDANANAWAREDGPFRTALRDYTISNDAATYSAAQAAYYVAYMQYSSTQQQVSKEWGAYVNDILSEVTVELATLVV